MRRVVVTAFLLVAPASAVLAREPADERRTPKTPVEQMGYAIGVELAAKLKKEKFDFDVEMAAQGLRDAMSDQVQIGPAELEHILKGFQAEFRRKMALNRQLASLAHRERNEIFFNQNRVAEGVKLLPSGVQYRVLREGSGRKPSDASIVKANFVGTLLDGTEFDRSAPEQPARLKVSSLVQGWRIALSAMPAGSHWQVWVPASLAWGERGNGGRVGPQEPLALDIELLDVTP